MLAVVEKPVGRIKTTSKDFVVREIVNGQRLDIQTETFISAATSRYTEFILTKKDMESEAAYEEIARQLGIARNQLTDHGKKDATALTSQKIVIEGWYTPYFRHEKMRLRYVGPAPGPLTRGRNEGNHFSIVVRTDATLPPPILHEFLNLFGPQRFGDGRLEVGKLLLEGNFAAAAELLEGSMNWNELKRIMWKGRATVLEAIRYPEFRRTIGWKIQQWQSQLWNELAKDTTETELPTWSPAVASLYRHLWNPVISELHPKMVARAHSFMRPVKVQVKDPVVREYPGGFLHQFALPPGSYATEYFTNLYEIRDISRENYEARMMS